MDIFQNWHQLCSVHCAKIMVKYFVTDWKPGVTGEKSFCTKISMYFIWNHVGFFSKILVKSFLSRYSWKALKAEINIVSSTYNFRVHVILFLLCIKYDLTKKLNIFQQAWLFTDNYRDLFELQITNIINIYKCFTIRGKDIHVSVCLYWSNIVCLCLFLTKACCVLWGKKMVNIVRLTLSVIFSISWQFGLESFKRGRGYTFYFSKGRIQPQFFSYLSNF